MESDENNMREAGLDGWIGPLLISPEFVGEFCELCYSHGSVGREGGMIPSVTNERETNQSMLLKPVVKNKKKRDVNVRHRRRGRNPQRRVDDKTQRFTVSLSAFGRRRLALLSEVT